MADLYSIIKATEHLEAAFARDAVSQDDVSKASKRARVRVCGKIVVGVSMPLIYPAE